MGLPPPSILAINMSVADIVDVIVFPYMFINIKNNVEFVTIRILEYWFGV